MSPTPERALPPLLSLTQAAWCCSVSKRLVDEWCLTGRIVSIKVGGRRLIPRDALLAWIEAETVQAEQGMAAGTRTDVRFRRVGA